MVARPTARFASLVVASCGDIVLGKSLLGGLKATIRLPL
jgi:hypothetical protein